MFLDFLPKTVEFINLHEKSYRVNQIVDCGIAVLEIKIVQFGITIKFRAFDVDKNILTVMRQSVCILPNHGTNEIDSDVAELKNFCAKKIFPSREPFARAATQIDNGARVNKSSDDRQNFCRGFLKSRLSPSAVKIFVVGLFARVRLFVIQINSSLEKIPRQKVFGEDLCKFTYACKVNCSREFLPGRRRVN